MGGFVKRCSSLNLYFKMENRKGQRIEDLLFARSRQVRGSRHGNVVAV